MNSFVNNDYKKTEAILNILLHGVIDFIIYNEDGIIPIEVKASDNTQSKSLNEYMKRFKPKYAIRISDKNFGFENGIKSVPLYATFLVK